jgi:hypothetical protein
MWRKTLLTLSVGAMLGVATIAPSGALAFGSPPIRPGGPPRLGVAPGLAPAAGLPAVLGSASAHQQWGHDAVAAYGGGGSFTEDGCYSSYTHNRRRVAVCDELT